MNVNKVLVNYTGEFSVQYKVSLLDFPIKRRVENRMFSGFLPKRSHTTYIQYVEFVTILLKNEQLLSSVGEVEMKKGTAEYFRISQWHSHVLYGLERKTCC